MAEINNQEFAEQVRQVFDSFFDMYELKYNNPPLASGLEPLFVLQGRRGAFAYRAEFRLYEISEWKDQEIAIQELEKIRDVYFNEEQNRVRGAR